MRIPSPAFYRFPALLTAFGMLRSMPTSSVLEYRAVLSGNRDTFLLEHSNYLKAFDCIARNFEPFFNLLSTASGPQGKSSISLIPFIALLQRQSTFSFEAFASFQSYQGWVIMRPGIEAVLFIGKFVDDTRFFEIWKNRDKERKNYRNSFSGNKLCSNSLPESARIQSVLSTLNDDFVHVNPAYYYRHVELAERDPGRLTLSLHYFDRDSEYLAHLIAFQHLILKIQESLAHLLRKMFAKPLALQYSSVDFRKKFQQDIRAATSQAPRCADILRRLGLINEVFES